MISISQMSVKQIIITSVVTIAAVVAGVSVGFKYETGSAFKLPTKFNRIAHNLTWAQSNYAKANLALDEAERKAGVESTHDIRCPKTSME